MDDLDEFDGHELLEERTTDALTAIIAATLRGEVPRQPVALLIAGASTDGPVMQMVTAANAINRRLGVV